MDWEELKMSIRKTTGKGRRSKSRSDAQKESSSATTNSGAENANKEISIDITLDMNQESIASSAASEKKRPPMLRRISGGWADTSGFKSSKSKRGSADNDRFLFNMPKTATSVYAPDIPVIPDLDDIKDEVMLNEIVEPPNNAYNHIPTLMDLESDLLIQKAFSQIENVDLSILTRGLFPQNTLDETDEVWEWDKLFTEVVAELNSEKRGCGFEPRPKTNMQKLNLAPDELPPPLHI